MDGRIYHFFQYIVCKSLDYQTVSSQLTCNHPCNSSFYYHTREVIVCDNESILCIMKYVFQEIHVARVADLSDVTGGTCSSQDILQQERLILNVCFVYCCVLIVRGTWMFFSVMLRDKHCRQTLTAIASIRDLRHLGAGSMRNQYDIVDRGSACRVPTAGPNSCQLHLQ